MPGGERRVIILPEERARGGARRRVAAYARVSTDSEEQKSSYAAQVAYYTALIQSRADWELVEVYTDEGISGTSTRHRAGFQRMVADALAGKIDLIVTKSVSRFARNTVDSLTAIRTLKEHGTEVWFEKENIHSFDSKGELLLTIMSSLAQEESRSISENVRWGNRKKFSDGRYSLNYRQLLGYDRGPDGRPVPNREQAGRVRRVYGLFLTGRGPGAIASMLTAEGVPPPGGGRGWYANTVRSILSNETYMGDKLLQKTYCADYLSKSRVRNRGELPRYYVEGDHEAIIPPDTFRLVQEELTRRAHAPRAGESLLFGLVYCAGCGGYYRRRVWHSAERYRKVVWRCTERARGPVHGPTLPEEELRAAFRRALRLTEEERAQVRERLRALPGGAEPPEPEELPEACWRLLVDRVTVGEAALVFTLANGAQVRVER